MPRRWLKRLLRLVRPIRALAYRGTGRYCPVCNRSSDRFASFGRPARKDAQCVQCDSLERHRLVWLFFLNRTDLFRGARCSMLHVAPESCLEPRLRQRLGPDYLTADLLDPAAEIRMDVTRIGFPDRHFDVIYCSHVLEHVPDDRRAMAEFHRVLKDDGWAVLVVPITAERTVEDPGVTDPAERLRLFGQEDHVRRYGPDFVDRLRAAGFRVETVSVGDLATEAEAERMGLTADAGDIFFCTKGGAGHADGPVHMGGTAGGGLHAQPGPALISGRATRTGCLPRLIVGEARRATRSAPAESRGAHALFPPQGANLPAGPAGADRGVRRGRCRALA